MNDHPLNGVLDTTMEKIKSLVDVNTIIGNPLVCGDDMTLIPISKVTFGFASGGSDFPATSSKCFGGGTGAGVTITPIAFVVAHGNDVRLLNINTSDNTADKAISMIPEIFDKVSGIVGKKDKGSAPAEPTEGASV